MKWLDKIIDKFLGTEKMIKEYVKHFPGKCFICSYHRFGFSEGFTTNKHPEDHDCLDEKWWCYLVRCKDNALYCGITNDLMKRVRTHNSGKGSRSVIAHGLPVHLVWYEPFNTKSEAMKEEYRIKKLSKKNKEELISEES